ncbi:MAG TPA: hypothetical protein DDW23_04870 [Planctomycetes bacterium]|nr:hypothetical protein [Planctomycetota bacterium]
MKICRRGTPDVWEISPGQVIGRLKSCAIQIDDSSISRQHARIEERAEELWIVDMGSSNGTFRNGQKTRAFPLMAGDLLTLGKVACDLIEETGQGDVVGNVSAEISDADARRAQIRRELNTPEKSRGFGDLDQQPAEIKFLALALGCGMLWGAMELVQWISATMNGG